MKRKLPKKKTYPCLRWGVEPLAFVYKFKKDFAENLKKEQNKNKQKLKTKNIWEQKKNTNNSSLRVK